MGEECGGGQKGPWISLYMHSLSILVPSGSLVEHAVAHWQNILLIILCKPMAIVSGMASGHSFV